jgi:NADP-dependent 3-hydroxy acid dehydrogenase YdfG
MHVNELNGKVAWVTGAGTGIGEAAAVALARDGMAVVLTGRRKEPLDKVAAAIAAQGGKALVKPADMTNAGKVNAVVDAIRAELGRIDVLVNNAGVNIPDRTWQRLTPEGIDTLIQGNLSGAFYAVQAVLPVMREQGDGVMIHTASWAGRFIGPVSGPVYMAAKHGVVAMSHSINVETPDAMARMIQPDDMGRIVAFVARQPKHVCINEMLISPTHNRGYIRLMQGRQPAAAIK